MSPRLTPDRVRRKLLLAVGKRVSWSIVLAGPPLAGWAPLRRNTGERIWLRVSGGRPVLRYTEPRVYRDAKNALTPNEALALKCEFYYQEKTHD